jgi:SP family galactose:H+ symporter-like MFS transporter
MTNASPDAMKPEARQAPKNDPIFLVGVILLVIVMAGALFGYDQGVISGALSGIRQEYSLNSILVEVVTSWVTLGALFGSLAGGELADRIGRRKAVLAAACLFIVGALIQAFATGTAILVLGRFIVGTGVGVAAVAAPLYSAEMAPPAWRGRFVSAYQLAITIGIFCAYLVDQLLSSGGEWRLMLGVSAVPALILLPVAFAAPESPRWLVKKGRRDDALKVLTRLHPAAENRATMTAIEQSLCADGEAASWAEVFDRKWRRPLVIALGLAIFQQITGINAIIYYANPIFAAAGFATPAAQTMATTWAIGGVNVIATFIAIAYIDKIGRRPLLLIGLVGMGISLVVVGFAIWLRDSTLFSGWLSAGVVTLIALVVFITSFAFSLGPVVWTVINEIFPGHIRGRAVAVATAVNWGSAFLVSQFSLTLTHGLGIAATFWLFAFFCAVSWIWIYRKIPETKGRTLEQIEQFWGKESASGGGNRPAGQTGLA